MTNRSPPQGFTLTELLAAAAIMGVLLVGGVRAAQWFLHAFVRTDAELKGVQETQRLRIHIGQDLIDTVHFDETLPTRLTVRLDSSHCQGYQPEADPDGDGLPNRLDPDDDGDADTVRVQYDEWWVGHDLDDDDDDNDGKRDCRVRWEFSSTDRRLTRSVSINEEPFRQSYGAKGVAAVLFDYAGDATRHPSLDFDNDGNLASADLAANPAGNGNEWLDTCAERRPIVGVKVRIDMDPNGDGGTDHTSATAWTPHLVGFRRPLCP